MRSVFLVFMLIFGFSNAADAQNKAATAGRLLAGVSSEVVHGDVVDRVEAALLLGQQGEAAIPALSKALRSDISVDVRAAAATALGDCGGQQAIPILVRAMREDSEDAVRASATSAIGHLRASSALDELRGNLRRENYPLTQRATLRALIAIGADEAIEGVSNVCEGENVQDRDLRMLACELVGIAPPPRYDNRLFRTFITVNVVLYVATCLMGTVALISNLSHEASVDIAWKGLIPLAGPAVAVMTSPQELDDIYVAGGWFLSGLQISFLAALVITSIFRERNRAWRGQYFGAGRSSEGLAAITPMIGPNGFGLTARF